MADTSTQGTSAVTAGDGVNVAVPEGDAEQAERPEHAGQPGQARRDGAAGRLAALGGWITTAPSRLGWTIRAHWQFSLVLLAAAVVRAVIIVAYPPIMWFNDSYDYFYDAVTHVPDQVRPNGYPFFLDLSLEPFHSVYPVAIAQALLGLAMGVLIYAVLRRRGLPWWGAALAAVPVLFDVFEMQLEHMITADSLFTFLVTVAVVICCWRDRPSVAAMTVAGLMIGYATLVRSVGEPLLVVVLAGMLLRRIGWRRLAALAVGGIIPIAAYAGWFHHTWGQYTLTESSGTFLYSRVMTFAQCDKMHLPKDLKPLCDQTPLDARPPSQEYLWADRELPPYHWKKTPLNQLYGPGTPVRFTPQVAALTQKFAERAIRTEKMAYLTAVYDDVAHTFGWNRQPDPLNQLGNGNGPQFRFSNTPVPLPWWAQHTKEDSQANKISTALHKYLGGNSGQPKVNHPWAGFVEWYQNYFWFPGTLLGLTLLVGAAGFLVRVRRLGGLGLMPWLVATLLVVLPPVTAGFSYRYVVAAVPVACLAAALAFTQQAGEGSVRAWAANLGRHLGRRVPVEQD